MPFPLEPGRHRLRIRVWSHNSHPMLLVYSKSLGLRSGPDWEATENGFVWKKVRTAASLDLPPLSSQLPTVGETFFATLPWTGAVFLLVLILSLFPGGGPGAAVAAALPPHRVRWIVMGLLLLLGINNMWKLETWHGFDSSAHMEYVRYLVEHRSLPLASEGWQMFQPPLYYVLSAPLYALLSPWFDTDALTRILRLLPILCSLLQVEIVFRAARSMFREEKGLQTVAVVVSSLIPMHITISQFVGNEPLAGCLAAVVLLMAVREMAGESRGYGSSAVMGLVLGLALLAKASVLLLLPPLALFLVLQKDSGFSGLARAAGRASVMGGVSLLVAGWFFMRNRMEFGTFFIGGWDPVRGIVWWQDPGFRTWSQFTTFGHSLVHPVYSGVVSFFDALYSTMWLDGFLSGTVSLESMPGWNISFMLAGAWWSLMPALLIVAGVLSIWGRRNRDLRKPLLFILCSFAVFFLAILDLYLRLPIYSTAKSTYTVLLLPLYGLSAAAGARLLSHAPFLRALTAASLAAWAVTVYGAYFVW